MTKQPDSSSLYRPNEPLIRRWKSLTTDGKPYCHLDNLAHIRTITLQTRSLDSWAREQGVPSVDFVKLDVQGAELDILAGAQMSVLPHVLGLEVEVEFTQLYVDQPLFADVDTFVRRQGFTFFQFLFTHNGHFAGRMESPLSSMYRQNPLFMQQMGGQLLTADAFYLRDLVSMPRFDPPQVVQVRAMKAACIAEAYGQIEFAFELLAWAREGARADGDTRMAASLEPVITRAVQAYSARGNAQ